jgi:hypothetical protein
VLLLHNAIQVRYGLPSLFGAPHHVIQAFKSIDLPGIAQLGRDQVTVAQVSWPLNDW